MAALREVVDDYIASLGELRMNKKPLISMLTILAEDYVDHAPSIVEAVEAHLQKVQSDIKLPVLYLIDSIVKTVSKPYLKLFAKNIVDTFCSVFEKVDETTRANMWKLRQTWNEVFPIKKMFALDLRVHNIDPAWPVMSLPPGTLSEKAIKKLKEAAAKQTTSTPTTATTPTAASTTEPIKLQLAKPILSEEAKMHEQLLKKQKELIELQKQKIELELLQAKANLEQQRKQLNKQAPHALSNSDSKEESSSTLDSTLSSDPTTSLINPRDPRVKTAAAATLDKNIEPPCAELFKQEQLIEQLKQQIQAKLATEIMLNNALKEIANYKPEDVKPSNEYPPQYNSKKDVDRSERPQHVSTLALMSNSDYTPGKRSRSHKSRKHRKSRYKSPRSSSPSKLNGDSLSPDRRRSKRKRKNRSPSPILPDEPVTTKSVSSLREEQIISMVDLKLNKQRASPEKENEVVAVDTNEVDDSKRKEATILETKEDLDVRAHIAPSTKRKLESLDSSNVKKKKAENFDALFGKEDIDLRTLSNRSPTAPIFPNKGNSWAKIKSSLSKNDALSKSLTDRNSDHDRLGRPRLFKKLASSEVPKKHHFSSINSAQHIEIMLKQAAEQFNQGTITKAQYNILIQEVFQMCEDQKLKAAQKKELEMEMMIQGNSMNRNSTEGKDLNYSDDTGNNRSGKQLLQPKIPGQTDAGWINPWFGPWIPPPPMPPFPPTGPEGFRPLGPWQNSPLRPDYPSPFGLCSQMNIPPPTIGSNVPNRPIGHTLPCTPIRGPGLTAIGSGAPSGMLMPNVTNSRLSPNSVTANKSVISTDTSLSASSCSNSLLNATNETEASYLRLHFGTELLKQLQLPSADKNLIEEIESDTMKSINIDGMPREIRYYGTIGVVFMSWNDPRDISFQDGSRRVLIDGKHSIQVRFNDDYKEFFYGGENHTIKLGTPTRELYVNDKWYECYFGGQPISVNFRGRQVTAQLEGPIPQVKIGNIKRTDLVIGKIKLIINARTIVPIFLDAKPQIFEIEGEKCTLEFTDALLVVLLNGRPFNVEFGGLPKPIIIAGKKHFIGFSGLPHGFRPGFVKIKGMKGVTNKDNSSSGYPTTTGVNKYGSIGMTAIPEPPSVPPGLLDNDSNSQDCMEITYGISKPDSHLAVLSSVVPSAMAPSSGMSYQAEPMENPPSKTPPLTTSLNLGDLLLKLVDVGVVRNQAEPKKQDTEKEKKKKELQVVTATFDKPETLKSKQLGIVTSLYNGMQCSSCGIRFLPEMATRYSHHLDWHFRQNRKERELSKKAHSRLWYHDISDWIQFEEVEDLDDRVQSWFELEKQAENETAKADYQPSIPTGSDEKSSCIVCQETFEQFYNEEKEEWHFRPAIIYENKSYHPQCLKDYQKSLERTAKNLEKVVVSTEVDSQTSNELEKNYQTINENYEVFEVEEDDEISEIKADETSNKNLDNEKVKKANVNVKNDKANLDLKVKKVKKNHKLKEVKENVKNKVENVNTIKLEKKNEKIEVVKKEEIKLEKQAKTDEKQHAHKSQIKTVRQNVAEDGKKNDNVNIDDDENDDEDDDLIEIIEPIIKEIIIEDLIDISDDDTGNKEKSKDESVKDITKESKKKSVSKEEKKLEEEKIPDNVPLVFDNVRVKQEPVDELEEKLAKAGGVDTTQVAVKSSIDGNVELDRASRTLPASSSRIKINIVKAASTSVAQNVSEKKKPAETPKESKVQVRPVIAAAIKPSLQGKKMSILPTVEKGHELSGLCSVM